MRRNFLFELGEYTLLAIPVLRDNFVYLICRGRQAVLMDAGEARPVLKTLDQKNLQLTEMFITHTHHDHVGGCRELCERIGALATSPAVEARDYDVMGTRCRSISTPGHVAVHKIYSFSELGFLVTGDTLINGACGRLLGGTAEQLFESLQRIKSFPDETLILGGHDYLEENMRFALAVEPGNADMQARLALYQRDPAAAILVTLAEEKRTNPFLRVDSLKAFTALRVRKDLF